MKRLFIALVTGAFALGGQAVAQDGFSVGASIAYTSIEFSDSGLKFDGTDTGWKIFGTWMFSENWGIEGGWMDLGAPDDVILTVPAKVEADGFDVFFVGSMPVSESFDLFGKVGYVSWDAKATVGNTQTGIETVKDDGNDLALGVGGRWHLNEQFGLRGEYEWFDIADTDSAWALSIGFDYFFGK